ncbi:MAG: formate dehydrogenase subunit gamma [Rhodobacteraceae bacterium]|nr:formate dehydrogenase subunit gamma [Paracoccaceae bacterium]
MTGRTFSAPGDHLEKHDPIMVSRYRGLTRINHWITAAALIVLLLSGLALFHPALFFLTGLFGGGQTTRWLHPLAGLLLTASFALLFLQMWRLNLPRREDVQWAAHLGDYLSGHEERVPEVGKYNAGQKVVFWAMAGLILLLVATGIMIWEQYFPHLVSIPVRRTAMLVHSIAAILAILVFILHVYAAIWTRGSLRAMTRGTVTGGWAWKHHRKWLRELAGRGGSGSAE